MKKTVKYNLKNIMTKAWTLVKARAMTISTALKKAWADAKAFIEAINDNLITETVHTWYGWKTLGREVIHNSTALFQITVSDAKTKSGTRIVSYFGESQTCLIGEQD